MRGALWSESLGVAVVLSVLGLASGAHAQLWFDPSMGSCDIGISCETSAECVLAMGPPTCTMVGDGGDASRCRPSEPFFECCDTGMTCDDGDAVIVLGAAGPECICANVAISDCFEADGSPPIADCLRDPRTMGPAATIAEGDCDRDLCRNSMDPDPCDDTVGCGMLDAGPPDGGPSEGGPRDGGLFEGGPRDGGPFEGGPRDGGPDASGDANVCSTVVLTEEDCGLDGAGNHCDDDANGIVDDGCGEADAGEPEDAAPPPRDAGRRRDMGSVTEEDAGEEPEEDAGEEPKMDAGGSDPSTDGRVFRGSGGCGLCSVAQAERAGALPWVALGLYALVTVIRSRARRGRKPRG